MVEQSIAFKDLIGTHQSVPLVTVRYSFRFVLTLILQERPILVPPLPKSQTWNVLAFCRSSIHPSLCSQKISNLDSGLKKKKWKLDFEFKWLNWNLEEIEVSTQNAFWLAVNDYDAQRRNSFVKYQNDKKSWTGAILDWNRQTVYSKPRRSQTIVLGQRRRTGILTY